MLEDTSKKSKWSWNSGNSKLCDEIGVNGQKLKLSNIGIELHVESPLPPEWQQCLDLQVSSLILFFLITYYVYLLFMFFLLLLPLNSPSCLLHSSSFFLITNCVSLLLMVSFVAH